MWESRPRAIINWGNRRNITAVALLLLFVAVRSYGPKRLNQCEATTKIYPHVY